MNITAGSNAAVNNTVAMPAMIKAGHKTATTRCIKGIAFIATFYTLIQSMYMVTAATVNLI